MSDNKEHYHNKGEQDAAEGKGYKPPHGGILDDLITWSKGEMEWHREEREAYEKGWDNAKIQKR